MQVVIRSGKLAQEKKNKTERSRDVQRDETLRNGTQRPVSGADEL